MEDPRLAGGLAFSALLRDGDVEVEGKVLLGKVGKEKRIGVWHSEPVAELVRALGKDSDNFVAEMLFVALSAADGDGKKPWTSGRGAQVVKKWLESKKIELGGMRIENGSGLFDANHVSAELLAKVLAAVEENPRIYQDFVSHLAMGATDGTMQGRMTKDDLGQRVRAKTGTLEKVNALSGYVQRVGGRPPGAFSIIVVDAKASHAAVRGKIDDLVLTWAKLLG
jgi:D-alanyl-D-alanine carboxypeptidase/D-alanyl-D-alanine-endopeptidase (penicillin-binding protein 4)